MYREFFYGICFRFLLSFRGRVNNANQIVLRFVYTAFLICILIAYASATDESFCFVFLLKCNKLIGPTLFRFILYVQITAPRKRSKSAQQKIQMKKLAEKSIIIGYVGQIFMFRCRLFIFYFCGAHSNNTRNV